MHIAITGNIGSGKTSLTQILSNKLNATPFYESSENPYIGDFYEDMNRWAFNLQIFFLEKRIREAEQMLEKHKIVIQDRTVYEDAYVFASNLHEMGLMATRDYETYMRIFHLITDMIPQPDLMIYLKGSVNTLVNQIRKRGRAYESGIQESYLQRLNDNYNNWIGKLYSGEVIVIDIDTDDFITNEELLDPVIKKINNLLNANK